jgi:hypothetical protein
MAKTRAAIAFVLFALVPLAWSRAANADDTVRRPGDHPHYPVEIEVHGLWGWTHYDYEPNDEFGLGAVGQQRKKCALARPRSSARYS